MTTERAPAIGLCLLFFIFGFAGGLQARERLNFVGIDKIEPMSWQQQGEPAGFICDLVDEIARAAGFEVHIVLLPFKRALKMLRDGETDGMISLHYKKGREAFALYPKAPLYHTRYCLFVKTERIFPFQALQDLYGKRIGKMSGWFLGKDFDEAVRQGKVLLDEATLLESNIRKIEADRIDAYLGTYFATRYELKKRGLKGRIVALPHSIQEEPVYLVLSRKARRISDKAALMRRIESAMATVQRQGWVDRLTDKYLE